MFQAWVSTMYMNTVPNALSTPRLRLSAPKATSAARTASQIAQPKAACFEVGARVEGRTKSENTNTPLDGAAHRPAQALAPHHQNGGESDVENEVDVVERKK